MFCSIFPSAEDKYKMVYHLHDRYVQSEQMGDADKWKRIEELSRMHDIQSEYYTHHEYTDDLKKEIEQMVERGEKNAG